VLFGLAWLPPASVNKGLLDRANTDQLVSRFIQIAGRAGFGMGIIRIGDRCKALWTHPRLGGSDLPDAGLSANEQEARIRACSALLKVPKPTRLLDDYRITET
jgi:hypothetical protein